MRLFISAALLLAAGLSVGCQGSNGLLPVVGEVLLDGQPAAGASVLFQHQDGQTAYAVTDPRGRFTLTTLLPNDGAKPGRYRAAVFLVETTGGTPANEQGLEDLSQPTTPLVIRCLIPERYNKPGTSGLEFDIDSHTTSLQVILQSKSQ